MPKPSVPYIRWTSANLVKHHQKRITKDAGCFEELMGIDPPPISVGQYRQRSLDTVADAWAEYEAEGRDIDGEVYREARVFFVDDDLVCSITDIKRKTFMTCFHAGHPKGKHFHRKYHDTDRSQTGIGDRRVRFKKKLKFEIQGKLIKKFKPIRGVENV